MGENINLGDIYFSSNGESCRYFTLETDGDNMGFQDMYNDTFYRLKKQGDNADIFSSRNLTGCNDGMSEIYSATKALSTIGNNCGALNIFYGSSIAYTILRDCYTVELNERLSAIRNAVSQTQVDANELEKIGALFVRAYSIKNRQAREKDERDM